MFKKKIFFTIVASCFLSITACTTNKSSVNCTELQTIEPENRFSFATNLLKIVNSFTDKENFCISPASAQWALSMTANGAEGNTAKQIYSALGYPGGAKEREAFNCLQQKNIETLIGNREESTNAVANSIWANKDIKLKNNFIEENAHFYDATVKNVVFDDATIEEINKWCSDKTEGKIKSIINEADPKTMLLLVNTLYLKAQWLHPFQERDTKEATFTKADGEKIKVQMMQQRRMASLYADTIIQATKRYFTGDYSMILVLPQKWVTMERAIEHFVKNYDKDFPKGKSCMLELSMPKFKCEFGTSLNPIFEKMGITDAFSDKANFSGISKDPLRIDNVIQKTFIEVNEKGAEAAAATAIMLVGMSARPMENKSLTLDRPFFYAITDNISGEILFVGKVGNPNN